MRFSRSTGCVWRCFLLMALILLCSPSAKPALGRGLQNASGTLGACSGGGVDVDLVATGTVEGVASSRVSSQIEVLVDEVLLGDESYGGETLVAESDSGTKGGIVGDVSFREGARYEFYLRNEGGAWKTSVCMGTRQLTEPPRSASDAPGSPASSVPSVVPETGGPDVLALLASGGLVLASIGAGLWWSARRLG